MNQYKAKAGDLVYFGGAEFYPSRWIALVTCSLWQMLTGYWISHVGLVIEKDGELLLAESTTKPPDSSPCAITGKCVDGVQAHHLDECINAYPGRVWISRLTPEQSLSEYESARLTDLATAKMGTPYDDLGAFLAGTRILKRAPWFYEQISHAYCSELTTWLLKNISRWPWESASISTPAGMAKKGVIIGMYQPLELIKKA